APCGGTTDRITRLARTTASSVPASSSPISLARARVAALRAADAQRQGIPPATTVVPTAAPISPGWSSPTVSLDSALLGSPSLAGPLSRRQHLAGPRVPRHQHHPLHHVQLLRLPRHRLRRALRSHAHEVGTAASAQA